MKMKGRAMKLTDEQLERLAGLGVKYPWDPGDVWPLVERIDELKAALLASALHCGSAGCDYVEHRVFTTGCRHADEVLLDENGMRRDG